MYQHKRDSDKHVPTLRRLRHKHVPKLRKLKPENIKTKSQETITKRLLSIREGGQETRNLSSVKENTGNINIRHLSKK
jgi:hypothetical protein